MKRNSRRASPGVLREGFEALVERLGQTDALRFIEHYQSGRGDYTKERRQLFPGETVPSLAAKIRQKRKPERKSRKQA